MRVASLPRGCFGLGLHGDVGVDTDGQLTSTAQRDLPDNRTLSSE